MEISLHTFSDLSHVSPAVFLYLLKECYITGKLKASAKFRVIQHQVSLILNNNPEPGPFTFAVRCLYILPIFKEHSEGFSHLILSVIRRYMDIGFTETDFTQARSLSVHLASNIMTGSIIHDTRILIKILQLFDIKLSNFEGVQVMNCNNEVESGSQIIDKYILKLVETESLRAVVLLKHFSLCLSGESYLLKMIHDNQFEAAEEWASFLGHSALCQLVNEYIEGNMHENAYAVIKNNNLWNKFPRIHHIYKHRVLKKFVKKGCWDIAEARVKSDRKLLHLLADLAMEADYTEKAAELCSRYSLEGVMDSEARSNTKQNCHLRLEELGLNDIIWVDSGNELEKVTDRIEKECKVIGIDCEWKPSRFKGEIPNKVSILQIGCERSVFIFDLIKLYEDVPQIFENCLIRILHSREILKIGYDFGKDILQLARSFDQSECFKTCRMLLDFKMVFEDVRGGLSGLAEKVLGAGLNKNVRISDWEKRPLSQSQLEYAALDAVVLVKIFNVVCRDLQSPVTKIKTEVEWKSFVTMSAITDINYVMFENCGQLLNGTSKGAQKFFALKQNTVLALQKCPEPGPATFVVHCLYALPCLGQHGPGFCHLILSALRQVLKNRTSSSDFAEASRLATILFICKIQGYNNHNARVFPKTLQLFDIGLSRIRNVICDLRQGRRFKYSRAKQMVEEYITKLIESRSYLFAVFLSVHFRLRNVDPSFLLKMIEHKQFKTAEKWSKFMGKQHLCVLVFGYIENNMQLYAYDTIRRYNLWISFPEEHVHCKMSALKRLVDKGRWCVAEEKANKDLQLIEYLVLLALESGNIGKVDELSGRYAIKKLEGISESGENNLQNSYMYGRELVRSDIIWIDDVEYLRTATNYILECKLVGVDCEGNCISSNKIAILQIASEKRVHIFDLKKLFKEVPDILDDCLSRIFQSPRILKLGYNLYRDMQQLAFSYSELRCFKLYKMILDIWGLFRGQTGGLSALTEKMLGVCMDKMLRNTDWEKRPLSDGQLVYAARDAVVLLPIFYRICGLHCHGVSRKPAEIKWASHIVSHLRMCGRYDKKRLNDFQVWAGLGQHFSSFLKN